MTHDAVALARHSRAHALAAVLDDPAAAGMARPRAAWITGPDAARFLHSQLTNDVEGLSPGQGQHQARVARTGHLLHLFTLHRVAPDRFLVLGDTTDALLAELDGFLFADDVVLAPEPALTWLAVQGPAAADVLDAALGPLGFEPWSSLPEGAIRPLRRGRGDLTLPDGAWAVRRSLGGDVGFLLGLPADAAPAVARALPADALVSAAAFSDALEILRVEAGIPRVDVDCLHKRRLLPETGQEQRAVSYTKGCYLGQEVIARVRTYGSVPFLLRGLLLDDGVDLPALGADLHDADGKVIGQLASAAWSVVHERPVALAWLDRAHRTPGLRLTVGGDRPFEATVALLPLYAAPDLAARVQQLYDLGVRRYADGDVDGALGLLERTLALDTSFGDAYEAIGVILGKAGRLHEAIDFFRRLEEVAPDEPMVNTNLSLYYMKLGDKETAEDEAGKATLKGMARLRGKGATDLDQDLEASKRKDATRKAAMFRRVLDIDADDAIALFGLGQAQSILGEYADAERHLRRAVTVDPKNSPVWLALGKALEKLDRADEAVEIYRQGVDVASRKGDLMPLKEMEHRLLLLGARRTP